MNTPKFILMLHESRENWTANAVERGIEPARAERLAEFLEPTGSVTRIAELLRTETRLQQLDLGLELIEMIPGSKTTELLSRHSPHETLVWNMTDGRHPYHGSYVPALARIIGLRYFGNNSYVQSLAQDKFKLIAVCDHLGVSTPPTVLVRDTVPISSIKGFPGQGPYFTRPCSLDNKLGVSEKSRTPTWADALEVSHEIFQSLGTDAIVQPFIDGTDLRVSYLDIGTSEAISTAVDIRATIRTEELPFGVESSTIKTSLGIISPFDAPNLGYTEDVDADIRARVQNIASAIGLRDLFAFDFRLGKDGVPYLLELNSSPFLGSGRFEGYLSQRHGVSLGRALLAALLHSFERGR